jgi:hypothetical protein
MARRIEVLPRFAKFCGGFSNKTMLATPREPNRMNSGGGFDF